MTCGRIYPNHSGGQRFILETGVIWPAGQAPAEVPAWIREQWPYVKALKHRDYEPANDDAPIAPPSDPVTPIEPGQVATLPPPPRKPDAANDEKIEPEQPRGFSFLNI
jgi:hypothetical protein